MTTLADRWLRPPTARTQFPHVNHRVLEDPRVVLSVDDGRNHLLRSDRKYDLIAMELSSIWFAGADTVPATTAGAASSSLLPATNGARTDAGMAWSETRWRPE